MTNLDEIEQLAKAAEQARRRVTDPADTLTWVEADAAYTAASRHQAAMKPAVTLTLVAELRAAREGNAQLLDRLEVLSAEGVRLENELRAAQKRLAEVDAREADAEGQAAWEAELDIRAEGRRLHDQGAELRAARESERRANSLYAAMRDELRAARRVVKAARGGSHPDLDEDEVAAELADALDAYDQVVAMREAGR